MGKTWMMVGIVALVFGVVLGVGMIAGRGRREAAMTEKTPAEEEMTGLPAGGEPTPTVISLQSEDRQGQITLDLGSLISGMVVSSNQLIIRGKTVPNAEVAVNGEELTADAKGNFSTVLTLDEGENTINVLANDIDGNWVEKEVTVTYETGE